MKKKYTYTTDGQHYYINDQSVSLKEYSFKKLEEERFYQKVKVLNKRDTL